MPATNNVVKKQFVKNSRIVRKYRHYNISKGSIIQIITYPITQEANLPTKAFAAQISNLVKQGIPSVLVSPEIISSQSLSTMKCNVQCNVM